MAVAHEQTSAEKIQEVLDRWSVTDLIEQTNEDLRRGDDYFYSAINPMKIISQGETGMIRWWKILSGDKPYEVRRYKNFVWCSCLAFFFRKKCCKHISVTANVYCARCFSAFATKGKYCDPCDMDMTCGGKFRPKTEVTETDIIQAAKSEWTPLCESKF